MFISDLLPVKTSGLKGMHTYTCKRIFCIVYFI